MKLSPVSGTIAVTRFFRGPAIVLCIATAVWLINAAWMMRDTRPPVWDRALQQTYALTDVPGYGAAGRRLCAAVPHPSRARFPEGSRDLCPPDCQGAGL